MSHGKESPSKAESKNHDDGFPIQDLMMMMMTFQDLKSEAECEASRKRAEIANKETRKKVQAHKSPPAENK